MKHVNWLVPMTLICCQTSQAQSAWMNHEKPSISLEIMKPSFDFGDNLTFATSVINGSTRLPISDKVAFVGQIPFAHYGISVSGFHDQKNAVGNPYFGVELAHPGSESFTEFGIRLPLTPDNRPAASFIGIFGDIDREDAFLPDLMSVTATFNSYKKRESGFVTSLRGGPVMWINTGDSGTDDIEVLLRYSGHLGFENESFGMGLGFSGVMILTENDLSFAERTIHQIDFGANVKLDRFKPGAFLRIPVDADLENLIDYVLGVNLEYSLAR